MTASGELPLGVQLAASHLYSGATGDGEIWLDERGLPLRLTLDVTFPEGERDQISAQIKTDFWGYGDSGQGIAALRNILKPGGVRALVTTLSASETLRRDVSRTGIALGTVALLLLAVTFCRRPVVYAAVAVSAVISMVATPLLNATQVMAFTQRVEDQKAGDESPSASTSAVPTGDTTGTRLASGSPSPVSP